MKIKNEAAVMPDDFIPVQASLAGGSDFAMKITDDTMNAIGIFSGDIVHIDPEKPLINGDIVVLVGEASVAPYRYQPPYYMPYTLDPHRKPLLAQETTALIAGVAKQQIRDLSSIFR